MLKYDPNILTVATVPECRGRLRDRIVHYNDILLPLLKVVSKVNNVNNQKNSTSAHKSGEHC